MQILWIYLAFLLSGAAGLIYQVIWVRFFGNVFGNTIWSASLVTAVFMLGLGVGGYFAGRWIDRRADGAAPLRAYGIAEALIGLMALGLGFLLPNLEVLATTISSYTLGPDGWYEVSVISIALRYLVGTLLLLPITMLMGATLTVLIRHVVSHHLEEAGWRIGVLYGVNTLGAAIGAFLTDFALVPMLGLIATVSVAVAFNFASALIAFRNIPRDPAPLEVPGESQKFELTRPVVLTGVTIFLSGAAAMGIEIVWFRFFNVSLGGYRSVFSLLISVMLVAMWCGSTLGGLVHRRFGHPAEIYMVAQTGVVVSALYLLWAHTPSAVGHDLSGEDMTWSLQTIWQLKNMAVVMGLPALLMGFAYPVANALVQDAEESIGTRAGALYLANTAGAVTGSLVTGFVLLPWIGSQNAMLVLASVAALSVATVSLTSKPRWPVVVAALVISVAALASWNSMDEDEILTRFSSPLMNPDEEVLTASEGLYETISVSESATGSRRLNTNGHSMSATGAFARRYMRLFSHVPLLHLDDPENALVICFGVGSTANAASMHPLERLEIVDLSRHVLDHADYFEDWNENVLDDPRVDVYIQDGRSHLRMRPDRTYDLVTLEPPPIRFAGVSALYSEEFYELAKSKLTDRGFVTQWLPAYQVSASVNLSIVKAFVKVFPDAILLSGAMNELILVGQKSGPPTISLDALNRRISERPRVRADLPKIAVENPTDFIGLFAASGETLREATTDVRPVTDDYPIMEYDGVSGVRNGEIPAELFAPFEARTWCPTCWDGSTPDSRIERINQYLAVMDSIYDSPLFLEHDGQAPVAEKRRGGLALPPGVTPSSPVIQKSGLLRIVIRED